MQKKAFLFSAGEYLPSKYLKIDDLSGVKHDVSAMEKRLMQIGFNVTKYENLSKKDYLPVLEKDTRGLPNDDISIVYFSGHGGHYNGENYIFPSDFGSLYDVSKDISTSSINIKDIFSIFKGKGRLIAILDACRCDIGVSKGYFSEMTSAENVYIAYGTMFQAKSIGVNSGLSWFTEAICDEILAPNIDVDTLFTRVRQNIFTKHHIQIPSSVNALLDKVILHSEVDYDNGDKEVYDFIQRYGDEYTDKYGYFHGDDLIFIDVAQYFDIGLLDAIWKFRKVDNKIFKDKGIKIPELSEEETKLISFLGFQRGKKFFECDDLSHTWYYNGRQIRMGEIPPLPPSMQQELPEQGKELDVEFEATKENSTIIIKTNLPEKCDVFVWDSNSKFSRKISVLNGAITINDAMDISKVIINSGIFAEDNSVLKDIGNKSKNLVGKFVKYHPIHGNQIYYSVEF